jgi:hypothetical protein
MKKLATALLLSSLQIASAQTPQTPNSQSTITFRDITQQSGIRFFHNNAAFGKKYLPETMGPGVAFIDYDNDGWPDIFLVNGTSWPGQPSKHSTPKLYHNNHDGTFTDVTHKAGLDIELFGMGVAVGDYDNDGFDDLFVTALGQSHLFHNNGNGTFTDVTQKAGLAGPKEFSTSAAWVDYDKDGKLDLVVANYVQWSIESDLYCTLDGKSKSYCTPESYKGTSVRLWHNRGDGTFEDVTKKAGLGDPTSKTLGIAVIDCDNDGWPDLLLSNDTQPNKLYRNNGNGTFTEKAVVAGVAFSEDGVARAGMGVDAADYDHSGAPSILITNFSNQMISLYHNEGKGLFVDEAPRSDVGRASLLTLGFGCFFFDYDLDGWPDIFIANGHIDRPDLLLSTNGGPAYLFLNEATGLAATNKSLRIKLVGTKSNRDGIGAVVKLTAGGETQTQMLRSGSSYLSASELILTFGLGQNAQADTLEIRWPSGQLDKLSNIPTGQTITITESKGITANRKFTKPL